MNTRKRFVRMKKYLRYCWMLKGRVQQIRNDTTVLMWRLRLQSDEEKVKKSDDIANYVKMTF